MKFNIKGKDQLFSISTEGGTCSSVHFCLEARKKPPLPPTLLEGSAAGHKRRLPHLLSWSF